MRDSVRDALALGGVGALCGGCVSLLYVLFSAAVAAIGIWFWGLLGLAVVGGVLGAAAYLRRRRARACEVESEAASAAE